MSGPSPTNGPSSPLGGLPRQETLAYLKEVHDRLLDRLDGRPWGLDDTYFVLLAILHEDMHGEAFACTRQTLGYPPPPLGGTGRDGLAHHRGPLPGDVAVP